MPATIRTVQFDGGDVYLTRGFEDFQNALDGCRHLTIRPERMALILGAQGTGKTLGARYFCAGHPDTAYIEIPPAPTLRTGRLLKLIEAELGIPGGPTLFDRMIGISDALARRSRMLVLDIGNRLRRYDYIDVLRYIHDRGRARMAFVGVPALELIFRQHREFAGRVQIRHEIKTATLAEATTILPDFSAEAVAEIHRLTDGVMRQMLVIAHAFRENRIPRERRTADAVNAMSQEWIVSEK